MKHNCFLESYDLKSKTRPGIFIPNFETCPIEKPRINRKKILTEVAKFMQTILYDQTIAFKLKYPSLLADHGYYSWYQAYYPELKEDIFRFYGETVIKNYWLPKPDELVPGRRFYEDRPIQNPVKHVLLQYFLKNNKRKDPLREELKALEEKHERDRTKMKELTDLYNETKSFDVLMQIDQVFRSYGV